MFRGALGVLQDPEFRTISSVSGGSLTGAAVAQGMLSDGGVYDNLGVEPVWKSHAVVLVSDGSGIFQGETDQGVIWRTKRYPSIQGGRG
ncbi:MAG: hypothetical protein ABI672_21255 [Vicinamibacteria bacterium]